MDGIAMYTSVQGQNHDALVMKHAPMVKRIAYHLLNRLPDSIQVEDLIQAGMMGLLEATRNFDNNQGATFETYAGIRVRGAMLDEVRRCDWTPRSVHRKSREVSAAMREIESATGRDARDSEVAEKMGITLHEYHQILVDSAGCKIFSTEALLLSGGTNIKDCKTAEQGPMDGVAMEGFKEALADSISSLPERERLAVSLYYEEEMNLKEIGEVLGVSESRVCQINSQAMFRLRSRMHDWLDETES
ncbi:MAG: RNA polymerase sigma factor FliA [Gammaproteobacteria bacterium]|nr:MAG: RNA polymerase sigma factor FliA [Gammaproteobacteria bacterium]RLA23618.1 MAG: RNA polymerase sigma factor FliA [Gammaproteobacteria bacterium]